ncbi:hypothetical protein A8709_13635 [Paenibacillus pectinilyticus]|uniref:Mannosylglycerate hydrolase MGH1-like glycoside hydrolase domain-containing protein n=1 Tax=Paenibacillus pectinilyticus TaxID=512399 RepID=A0A1C1A3L0_9BACL|nr:hypothetical protein [Paenibacillus pectinilyticus]OCT15143.1 hypothetical protein A8709_13635 [Paenibacillus pectinilyticus]
MKVDVSRIAWSYPGSYYTLSQMTAYQDEPEGLYIRTLHKDVHRSRIARLVVLHEGQAIPYREEATATSLSLISDFGSVKLIFEGTNTIQFYGENVGLGIEFIRASHAVPVREGQCDVNCDGQRERVRMTMLHGKMAIESPWNGDNADYVHVRCEAQPTDSSFEGVFELYRDSMVWPERTYASFAESLANVEASFAHYLDAAPKLPAHYSETRELAAYVNWMSLVKPYGHMLRPTMYASKNGMSGIWSWDHCFHAMAVAEQDPDLAWHQWMTLFDHQDAFGTLPDTISDGYIIRSYVKPPIHGFALQWMMTHTDGITKDMLAEAYSPLSKWTNFWLKHRDSDGDGIPEYHNGNDSGWDNSTIFYEGIPLESPDLATYLIIQMETLATIAHKLGKVEDARQWTKQADYLLANMLEHFIVDDVLCAKRSGSHEIVDSKSLIMFIPLLLGERLPKSVRDRMIEELKIEGAFLTKYGLSSERLDSDKYEEDGYWRGPIWAPPMFILSHALRELGEISFSQELARRFCDLVALSGMAENFHAETGKPLRDPGIVWTSSVFLLLGSKYL